jgi:hypothetical protein
MIYNSIRRWSFISILSPDVSHGNLNMHFPFFLLLFQKGEQQEKERRKKKTSGGLRWPRVEVGHHRTDKTKKKKKKKEKSPNYSDMVFCAALDHPEWPFFIFFSVGYNYCRSTSRTCVLYATGINKKNKNKPRLFFFFYFFSLPWTATHSVATLGPIKVKSRTDYKGGGGGRILTEIQKGIREIYTVWRTIHSAGGYV